MFNRFLKPETRYARRMARIARFERPIAGPGDRLRAWANMLLMDHGVFRLAYLNRHRVGTGALWRSAQPGPHQLARFRAEGVRTIISLRGGREHGSWPLQREACERHGLILREFVLRSREAPDRETILAAKDFFASVAYPAVMHCKSGADRAGLMSVLYAHLRLGLPLREALKRELSFRTLHVKQGKTGVLDYTFERYFAEGEPRGLTFAQWTETEEYDPKQIKADFQAAWLGTLLTEKLLRRE